jgi:CheY-like chemotaxis protein
VGWARAIIDRQVNQLVRLVDDLLDVARITQGKIRLQMEPLDIGAVVEMARELSGPLIESRQHQLAISNLTRPLWVRGDSARLAQVLSNLLNNAAKYTDKGGRLSVSVTQEEKDVVVVVRDNGIGIPPEMVDVIFDLFTQANRSLDRSQGGLGIGLTLVRHIVQMHGGSVAVKSEGYNQGSEFCVRLPLYTPAAPVPSKLLPPPAAPAALSNPLRRRVLVVDDNIDVADSLTLMLKQLGHEVCMVHEGKSALSAARIFCPQVVLLDIGLPGMDGYEVARRMRAMPELSSARLVALTGYGQPEARRKATEAGFDVHLVKPVDPQTLEELMHKPHLGVPPPRET